MMTEKSFAFTAAVAVWLFVALSLPVPSHAASTAPAASPECKVALRMITSPGYVRDHVGEIPDADTMSDDAKAAFIADLFRKSLTGVDKPEDFCANTIRENLRYNEAYDLPQQCVTFLPLLRKNFEEKIEMRKDLDQHIQKQMDESIVDMLLQDETDPAQLVTRCDVGIKVMQVDLNDRHLKQKYPLPVACEAMFAEMEKTMILPSQLNTIRRQRVLFAIENKDNPRKLDQICDEISR